MHKFLYLFLISAGLGVLASACKGKNETKAETTQEVSLKKPVADQVDFIPVELNNGEKWRADELTTLGIGDIKAALKEVDVTTGSEDYQVLIDNLESAIKKTYNSSELGDEAKAQLANYIDNIAQVTKHLESSDVFVRHDAVKELEKILDSFGDYFE